MSIIHPTSLIASLDLLAEAYFYQQPISKTQRQELAALIVSRQSQAGTNAGYFIPFTAESERQPNLFSGERLRTAFAKRQIQLIEAARTLKLLGVEDHAVAQALYAASQRMESMCYARFCAKGECKHLTVGFMRYLALDGSGDPEPRLDGFLTQLSAYRDGKGKWGGFPFYYTLLMLSEIRLPQAQAELQYSLPACERYLKHDWDSDPFSKRQHAILEKVLTRS